jgi:putative ABC transport system permease protein
MTGGLVDDLGFALRLLRRSPGMTLAAVLTLAIGIGATSAIFSVVDGVLLRPLPYPDSGALMAVHRNDKKHRFMRAPFSYPDFKDLLAQNRSFENVGVWSEGDINLTGVGAPERVLIRFASPTLLPTLRVRPAVGRNFTANEAFKGSDHVVMLDWGFAQRRFGSAEEALGKSVRLDGIDYQIVGILPHGFRFDTPADVWIPISTTFEMTEIRNAHWLGVLARKRPEATAATIAADLAAFSQRVSEANPDIYPASMGLGTSATPYLDQVVGDVRLPLLILLGAVAFVLLIACANVANLLLARAATRHREMAIRAALGAGRGRLVRQLLTESVMLAIVGGALSLIFAAWAVDGLMALAPNVLPRVGQVGLDWRVLAFTAAVAIGTGIAFGLVPALAASRSDLSDALKEGGRGATAGRGRLRKALVVAEVAASLVLLVGAGLMVRSFLRLRDVDPGFNPEHALTLGVSLPVPDAKVTDKVKARFIQFFDAATRRLAELPGTVAVGAIDSLPLSGNTGNRWFDIEGFTPADNSQRPEAETRHVVGDYFGAMGIPVVRGRGFLPSDSATAPPVVVVNQAWVHKFSRDRDPIGRHIRFVSNTEKELPWATIVGVIGNVPGYGLDAPVREEMYWLLAQTSGAANMWMVVRVIGDPLGLIGAARAAMADVDPQQPIYDVRPLDNLVASSLAQRRFTLTLMLLFGFVALVLAAVGIYGVMAYTVAQRTQEIGIRIALGATPGRVLSMVLLDGMSLVGIGLGLGIGAALLLTRVGASLLWGISSTDALTYFVIAAVLSAVALAAIVIPARRATRADPMQALRSE